MAKTPLQLCGRQFPQTSYQLRLSSSALGVSVTLSIAALAAWATVANALPVRVQGGFYSAPVQTVNPYVGAPINNSVYRSVQTTIQPGSGGSLSVQIGTPNYSPSGYGYGQTLSPQRGSVNNSVLINPTVINSPIRNSTLVNPTIVTTPYAPAPYYPAPYYPAPYYNIQTVTTVTRPEPQVVIDPQYGVRYQSPPFNSQREVVVDPQYGVGYQTVPSSY